jgi:hypothetical protein
MEGGGFLSEYGKMKSFIGAITGTIVGTLLICCASSICSSAVLPMSTNTSNSNNMENKKSNQTQGPNTGAMTIASSMCCLAIFIIIIGWIFFYFARKNKTFAKIAAISDIASPRINMF